MYAIVFPGQGSQSQGMLTELSETYPQIKTTFEIASNVLGYDLWDILCNNPEGKLDQTIYTQPVMLTAGFATWQILKVKQPEFAPDFFAGHSLGEYTALTCSEALDFREAVNLVSKRAECMQNAVPMGVGGMAAILGLTDEDVQLVCEEASRVATVTPANFNSPGQVVIGGYVKGVEKAIELAKAKGAKRAIMLPMSVPSHSPLMKAAAESFKQYLDLVTFKTPKIPVVRNVDATIYQSQLEIPEFLLQQLYQPVRWVETIQYLEKQGVKTTVECGPGKILQGLNKRIVKDMEHLTYLDML